MIAIPSRITTLLMSSSVKKLLGKKSFDVLLQNHDQSLRNHLHRKRELKWMKIHDSSQDISRTLIRFIWRWICIYAWDNNPRLCISSFWHWYDLFGKNLPTRLGKTRNIPKKSYQAECLSRIANSNLSEKNQQSLKRIWTSFYSILFQKAKKKKKTRRKYNLRISNQYTFLSKMELVPWGMTTTFVWCLFWS